MRVFQLLCAGLALPLSSSSQTIADFFNDNKLQEIRLTMNAAEWQTLKDKYLDSTVYHAQMVWEGIVLPDVGVNARGSGSRNPIKPGLKIAFNAYDSNGLFLGLKSLVLRNFAQDPSTLHEILTEAIFDRVGLPHSREVYAKVYVNGAYEGLYLVVEPYDKHFLRTRFGEDTGYLYEFKWFGEPYHFEYRGPDPAQYVPVPFEPKTNEKAPDAAHLEAWIRAINETPDADFRKVMDQYMDVGAFLAHVAAEQYLTETDGIMGFAGMANFYLYRRSADDRILFLVWDKEGTMTVPEQSIWHNTPDNILFQRAMKVPEWKARFLDMILQIHDATGGAGGWLSRELERYVGLIREALATDPNRVCAAMPSGWTRCSDLDVAYSIQMTREFVSKRPAIALGEAYISGLALLATAPVVSPETVGNLATATGALTPGSLACLKMYSRVEQVQRAMTFPAPSEMSGFQLLVGGKAAPLLMVGPNDVHFQVPWEATCGPTTLVAVDRGAAGPTLMASVEPYNAGVFAVTHADGALVTAGRPAAGGEVLVIYGTGIGTASSQMASGWYTPTDRLVTVQQTVTVLVGTKDAKVLFAGEAPGLIGLQQVVVEAPAVLDAGTVRVCLDGEPGPAFPIAIR